MNISPKALLTRLDSIPERKLLWVNIALACLVGLSHGGALAVSSSAPTEQADEIRRLALVSLPLAALVILVAATAMWRPHLTRAALGLHGIVFCISGAALLLWALSVLVDGLPYGKFVWTTGLLTAWIGYSVFVMSRYTISVAVRGLPKFFFLPVIAMALVLPVDIGVAIRLLSSNG